MWFAGRPLTAGLTWFAGRTLTEGLTEPGLAPSEARSAESRGGKSELRRAVRRVTPGQGDLKDSGTENIPPAFALRAKASKGEKVR